LASRATATQILIDASIAFEIDLFQLFKSIEEIGMDRVDLVTVVIEVNYVRVVCEEPVLAGQKGKGSHLT
jgi:hypothetical protein